MGTSCTVPFRILYIFSKVNGVFPYRTLYPANVQGTIEVIRLASRRKIKSLHYVSTMSVFPSSKETCTEDFSPSNADDMLNSSGYSQSKWVAGNPVTSIRLFLTSPCRKNCHFGKKSRSANCHLQTRLVFFQQNNHQLI